VYFITEQASPRKNQLTISIEGHKICGEVTKQANLSNYAGKMANKPGLFAAGKPFLDDIPYEGSEKLNEFVFL
jgi:hypothetical protein